MRGALGMGGSTGRILYGALFTVVLPVLLLVWAREAEAVVRLPAVRAPAAGTAVAAFGVGLMAWGMVALVRWGGGLPMNAYPTRHHVTRGPYRLVGHPIYVGFGMACAGVAVASGSSSGLWLVTPVVVLAMVALVVGYEGPALRGRFGGAATYRPLLSLPRADPGVPTAWERASVIVLVFLPWFLAFEGVVLLGVPPDAVEAFLPFERDWPVLVWTEFLYALVYPFVGLVPLLVSDRRTLRAFALRGLLATGVVTLLYLTVPLVAPPRPFEGGGLAGHLLAWERSMANTVAAFPSFHVIWALLAADAWSRGAGRWRRTWVALVAGAIVTACLTTGMHALADVAAGIATWWLLRRPRLLWEALRRGAERVANSWREWRFGPVRVLSYGFYAAAAGGVAAWLTGSLVGPDQLGGAAILLVSGLLGAGLWAQKLEGSSVLSRPFGYFGSLVGAAAGAVLAGAAGYDMSLLFAAIATAAPWTQAIGRLRCLVQGCCHGREAPAWIGIRYLDPRSRVCSIAGHRGVPLHPNPLYSILANLVIGPLLLRLWTLGASEGLIVGCYLMLAGIGRFVEEAYRGEPQTPVTGGLRLYQWLSVLLLLIGAAVTVTARVPVPDTGPTLHRPTILFAGVFALACLFAMGVDFPGSTRRFARLAPVESPEGSNGGRSSGTGQRPGREASSPS
jgi:protein-S-isoprenylcysteine O-methyltransferase Ste14